MSQEHTGSFEASVEIPIIKREQVSNVRTVVNRRSIGRRSYMFGLHNITDKKEKDMKRLFLLCWFLTAFLFVCGVNGAEAKNDVIELKYQCAYPPGDYAFDIYAKTLIELIDRVSDGQVKIKLYPPGALCSVKEMVNAVSHGMIDMAQVYGGMFTGSVPVADLEAGLPFSRSSNEQYIEMMWGPKYRLIDTVRKGYAKKNIHLLTPHGAGDYLLMLNFPIEKWSDLKGYKIRGAGAPAMWLRAAGAAPVVTPGSEVYMAMKLGTIDGTLFPAMILEALKLKEVVKYVVYPPLVKPGGTVTLINQDTWNSLPAKVREALTEKTLIAYYRYCTALYQEKDEMALDAAYKYGVKKIVLPEEENRKAIKLSIPIWDKVAEKDKYTKRGVEILKSYLNDKGLLK